MNTKSTSLIELGTQTHPYRSLKSAFLELLVQYSNKDILITIYLAEGQRYYIEDKWNYILNISNVAITSYSDSLDSSGKATIVPTQIPQPAQSQKAAFSLLASTDLNIEEEINNYEYTESESALLRDNQATICILRSNVKINNVDFERQVIDYDQDTMLFEMIYLQDKTLQLTNIDINVTGRILHSQYPMNGMFENITIDAYGLRDGFRFDIDCNYPEAIVVNEVHFNYLKVVTTTDRTFIQSPNIVFYQGPGNLTVLNSDFADHYMSFTDVASTIHSEKNSGCLPADGLLQTVMLDNITTSLPDNQEPESKANFIAITAISNLNRQIKNYVYNQHYINFKNSFYGNLLSYGGALDELYIIN